MENDILKRVHQTRPSLILNIDNEYMTFLLMEQMKSKLPIPSVLYPNLICDFGRLLWKRKDRHAQETLRESLCERPQTME